MKQVYAGKTKDVFALEDGNYLLQFKDEVTGEDGRIDPGSNAVLGKLEGKGKASLRMSQYFFELLQKKGIPTHYVAADPKEGTMVVRPAQTFGDGLEVVIRFRAFGSFLRRYGRYAQELQPLDALVEITLKDDERGDPPLNEETLIQLNLMTGEEVTRVKTMARQVACVVRDDLAARGLDLVDIKFEFGRINGDVVVIDDISGDNMRVFRNKQPLLPLELSAIVTGEPV
ncbi:MAG: phosphoribosylaminoimidazolesuccinocarboxamide synthase [Syntrophomonadaceae bacterium]|nr:phosphoribosylaminoimidazolesuccinocarboxamide synthase [Syntrophomonadaceae bacterium]